VALQRYAERTRLEDLADRSVAPLSRLRGHFKLQRAEAEKHGFTRGCLLGNLGAEVPDHSEVLRAAVAQNLARWAELITPVRAEAQHAGSLRPELDPRATARFVLSAREGTLISARADRSGTAFDSFFDLVFGILLT
jgi:TetR/AcrR family transcriptional repressor of nem operon